MLASAAVGETVADGTISHTRIAMGGIGTGPWRRGEAESLLAGKPPTRESFKQAAQVARNLADYIVATHADAPKLVVTLLDYPDL